MEWIVVDEERCLRDGLCVAVCPRRVLAEGDEGYPEGVPGGGGRCLRCGHCLAVCPVDALTLRGVAPEECPPVLPAGSLGLTAAEPFFKGRRSVREFREDPVPHETLEWLVDVVRWAPSAGNRQPVHWTIVDGRDKVRALASPVAEWLRRVGTDFYADVLAAWDQGDDTILRGAPHLAVAHAADEGFNPGVDCAIAAATLELAAHAVGVGACWAGFFMGAARDDLSLSEALALPPGHRVFAALMLGMPRYDYRRAPVRREARVYWR